MASWCILVVILPLQGHLLVILLLKVLVVQHPHLYPTSCRNNPSFSDRAARMHIASGTVEVLPS